MSARVPARCLWCGSTEVRKILWGMPRQDLGDEWFVGGCVIPPGPRPEFGCRDCGRTWLNVPLKIRAGEVIHTEQGPTMATRTDLAWVRQIRLLLLELKELELAIDSSELIGRIGLPYELDDLARLMDILAEDCERRGERPLSESVASVPVKYRRWDEGGVWMMPSEEVNRILKEDLDSRHYVDDPDHPYKPETVRRDVSTSPPSPHPLDTQHVDVTDVEATGDIECECMLCHLPYGEPHPPIEWRYTVHFPGPYPAPGVSTMLLCDPCYRDWVENQGTLQGHADRVHKV